MTNDFNTLQIRFASLADYTIPIGTSTFKNTPPYFSGTSFRGGAVIINNIGDEINGGTVVVKKNGDTYNIVVNATTAKGPVTASFEGNLKKI